MEYFNSNGAFEKHRFGNFTLGTRRCLNDAEMEDKGMSKNARGFWVGSTMELSFVEDRNALRE